MIEDKQVEAALFYVRDHAGEAGQLAGAVKEAEARRKTSMAISFLQATGTVAERQARSRTDPAVMVAYHDYCEAVADYEKIKLNIKAAEMLIEVWRTENSNRRAGIL